MRLRAATVTDGYKVNHAPMYADGTQKVYSNLTARTDRIAQPHALPFIRHIDGPTGIQPDVAAVAVIAAIKRG